jgi:non-specific serine/threonine protein kinase
LIERGVFATLLAAIDAERNPGMRPARYGASMDGRPDLRERSRRGRAPPTNLPIVRDRLIGRGHELTLARDLLLQDDVGLLTLTGPGGSGKTRLALQLATDLADQFDDGVWLVPLAPLRDPALIATTIGQALGLQDQGGRPPADTLRDFLHHKHLLLLVDNCEHLLEGMVLLSELLTAAPGLTIVATSRSPLNLHDEHELLVPPLALPDSSATLSPEQLLTYGAIELFVQRVTALQPLFQLTPDNASDVVESCRRLDGLPLALELAAARLRRLPPGAMLARLERRLPLLVGGPRDLPARQQTPRATIAWSYNLLTSAEQRLFCQLAVFTGGCALEAAEAIRDDLGGPEDDVLGGIDSLVEKSLLQRQGGPGEPRFFMLETIREYALEQLEAADELELAQRRHAEYFLALAERAEPALMTSAELEWLNRLDAEHDNLRAVLRWAQLTAESDPSPNQPDRAPAADVSLLGMRLIGALRNFWLLRGHWYEGRRWSEMALTWTWHQVPPIRLKLLLGAALVAQRQNDLDRSAVLFEQSVALARELGNRPVTAMAVGLLGLTLRLRGDVDVALRLGQESLEISQQLGWQWGIGWAKV